MLIASVTNFMQNAKKKKQKKQTNEQAMSLKFYWKQSILNSYHMAVLEITALTAAVSQSISGHRGGIVEILIGRRSLPSPSPSEMGELPFYPFPIYNIASGHRGQGLIATLSNREIQLTVWLDGIIRTNETADEQTHFLNPAQVFWSHTLQKSSTMWCLCSYSVFH